LLGFIPFSPIFSAGVDILVTETKTLVSGTETIKATINKNDSFDLQVTFNNNSNGTITEMFIVVDTPGSFFVHGMGSRMQVSESHINALNSVSKTTSIKIPLIYNGGGSNIVRLTIEYKVGAGTLTSIDETIGLKGVVTEQPAQEPPVQPPTIDTSKYVPRLNILNKAMPLINAGNTVALPLTIENNSVYGAKDIEIVPILEGERTPFIFDSLYPKILVNKIDGNRSENISLNFRVERSTPEGIYPIKLVFKYGNPWNDPFEETKTIFVRVINNASTPKLVVKNFEFNPKTVVAGNSFDLSLLLQNTGSLNATDVEVSLQGLKNDEFVILNSINKVYLPGVPGNLELPLKFSLSSSDKMKSGTYSLSVKIDYKDSGGKTYSEDYQIFVPVTNRGSISDDSDIKTIPKIIIDRFSLEPSIVRAGENFELRINFLNTNAYKSVRNIKIFLTAGSSESGSIFTPINSSNTFYIDHIGPKKSVEKRISFFTIPDAQPKTYTLTANFEYEDSEGNSYTASDLIGIPVVQRTRLEVSDFAIPPEVYMGNPISIFLEFYNTGKAPLYNLMIKTQGSFNVQNANLFVGTFERGNSDYYDVTIFPTEPGNVTGTITFSYEDATGTPHQIVKELSFNVIDMPDHFDKFPPGYYEPMPMPQPAWLRLVKNKFFWLVLITAGIIAALLIKIRMQKIKMRGLELDE
jgi:hypothetical protein